MHRPTAVGVLILSAAAMASPRAGVQAVASPLQVTSPPSGSTPRAVLSRYCVGCHTQAQKAKGTVPIALDTLDVDNIGADPAAWEIVVRKLRAGVMPPPGRPRPDKATHDRLVGWLEAELDREAARQPNPGRTEPLHRLNRTEYRYVIRDLLDLDIDVASLLPSDDASYGFDNIAGVLKLSPTLMERYLSAAQKISRTAIGTPPPVPSIEYFRLADDRSQDAHLTALPFGTRGGIAVRHPFPMDAEYEIKVRLTRDLNEGVPLYADAQQLEISIDGERVGMFTLPGVQRAAELAEQDQDQPQTPPPPRVAPPPAPQQAGQPAAPRPLISQIQQGPRITAREREQRNRADESWNLRVPVKAGPRDLVVTFMNRTSALEETLRLPFLRPYPAGVNIPETRTGAYLRGVEIVGPLNPRGAGDSPSRRRVFVCQPTGSNDAACARRILATLARRAYRRPIAEADLEPLLTFYREGRTAGFDAGIERALRRLLVSPEFLLRVERDPPSRDALRGTSPSARDALRGTGPSTVPANGIYRITDLELASRLSFFLWTSIPDDELIDVAAKGQLRNPDVLSRQVRRLLADGRATRFIENFAGQWLFLRNVPATGPVQYAFPDFDDTLREGFKTETELFVESIVRENRSALDLLRAEYTFLNERLARHYGIPNVKGSHFRRVVLDRDGVRRGLLGQGSILTVTSYPDRTSPVVRGKWILENLLGTPPPPPLPNVPPLKPTDGVGAVLSMRERMEQHRANPVCASCHALMDPLGLSLENFDAVGRWRTLGEAGGTIDASGTFPDGTKFVGSAGLRQALLESDRFVTTLTEKLLTYALGRGLEYYDAPAVRAIVRAASADEYRMASMILGIVKSQPFQMRRELRN
jgi:hypothetical protein